MGAAVAWKEKQPPEMSGDMREEKQQPERSECTGEKKKHQKGS
jgi:hypothetical protein